MAVSSALTDASQCSHNEFQPWPLVDYLWRAPDGLCINRELVGQGYARVYEPDKPKYDFVGKVELLDWEKIARQVRGRLAR